MLKNSWNNMRFGKNGFFFLFIWKRNYNLFFANYLLTSQINLITLLFVASSICYTCWLPTYSLSFSCQTTKSLVQYKCYLFLVSCLTSLTTIHNLIVYLDLSLLQIYLFIYFKPPGCHHHMRQTCHTFKIILIKNSVHLKFSSI